jgi:uncharacterized protein (DUF1330 family)
VSVYFIAAYDITDRQRYEQDYVPQAAATVSALGGEVVVASGMLPATLDEHGGDVIGEDGFLVIVS